jgi:tRNA threonylcarbamoyladenosine biosynthesis protein TsaE
VEVPELHLRTTGPEQTRAVASTVARYLEAGDVVALTGELGAGKTCFVQGAAAGLGVEGPVTSPTFVLVRHYLGRLPVVHCDVYRLDRLGDVLELGDEVLAPDVVTFVEWGDAVASLLPADHLEVELTSLPGAERPSSEQADPEMDGGPARRVVVRLHGRAAVRHGALSDALVTWQEPT